MVEAIVILQEEYCPPIDPALFYAIVSDYDLADAANIRQLGVVLDALKESALVEEVTAFDPSGSGGDAHLSASRAGDTGDNLSDRAESCPEWSQDDVSCSRETDLTSLSQSMGLIDLHKSTPESQEDDKDAAHNEDLENLELPQKLSVLKEMFPTIEASTVDTVLVDCYGNVSKAIEALLNRVFLDDETNAGNIPKGIDGFAHDGESGTPKRAKVKKQKRPGGRKGRRSTSQPPLLADITNEPASSSRWKSMQEDIDFLADRVSINKAQISSLYHQHGASLVVTLMAMLDANVTEANEAAKGNAQIQEQAIELIQGIPAVSFQRLVALIHLTSPSQANAHELAYALTAKPKSRGPSGIQIITRLPPIDLQGSSAPPTPKASTVTQSSMSHADALSASYGVARTKAFHQAQAAYRKGKSDHLMGAVAGYYSRLGWEYDEKAKTYGAAAADALVASQSTRDELDLHGVNVKDAVRIAKEQVNLWWISNTDSRVNGGMGSSKSFNIITGSGKHSEGGRAKIGPAVSKMLVKEGWKTNVGDGSIFVTGAAKGHN
ncbi:MAG: hypothetical protein M1833_001076 [Piccolia ochrophora]|nr:MAG: hypothetical protein M1833_001076 [Piccolia ochrophora]